MATLKFKKLALQQFKGVKSAEYELSEKTDIIGKNGSGKSTIATAINVVFTGKDASGRSNPEIRPDDMPESEPHITIDAEIDGKPITLEMIQKDTRTKKDREADKPPKIANKFRINGVDKSATAFKSDILERGIDLTKYESLTNTNWFNGLKEADKRKAVFELVEDITDADVCKAIGAEVNDVLEKLDNYTLEEITALAKQQKKAADARLDAIPEQIIGLEKGKPEIEDLKSLKAKRQRIEASIDMKNAEVEKLNTLSTDALESSVATITAKQAALITSANAERENAIQRSRMTRNEASNALSSINAEVDNLESRIKFDSENLKSRENIIASLLEDYERMKSETFPEEKTICPTCGQKLPKEKISELKDAWQKKHDKDVADAKETGNRYAKDAKKLRTNLAAMNTRLAELKASQADAKKHVEDCVRALDNISSTPVANGSDIPEYQKLESELEEVKAQIAEADKAKSQKVEILTAITLLKSELADIDRELGKSEMVRHIDKEILSLKNDQKQAAQSKADAEKLLYHLSLVSQQKNAMLSEAVNSKFPDFIRFKLFKTLKNGEVVDCCEPEIRNEQGEWKNYNSTANNSLKLRADIAILQTFQKEAGMNLPIICDNSEALDSNSKSLIQSDSQLIFLTVKDDTPLTVTELK